MSAQAPTPPPRESMSEITLGQKARDVVTGFEGIVTGRADYLTGCSQFVLAPRVAKDGTFKEGHWFDESRLEVTDRMVITLRFDEDTPAPVDTGGPQPDAPPAR